MKKIAVLFLVIALASCETEEEFNATACFEAESGSTQNQVTFNNCSQGASHFMWDFGDGNTSTQENPTHQYAQEGSYQVTLLIQNESFYDINGDGVVDTLDEIPNASKIMTKTLQVD